MFWIQFQINIIKYGIIIMIDNINLCPSMNQNINSMELPLDFGRTSLVFHLFHENTQTDLAVSYEFKTFALAPGCDAIDLISISEAEAATVKEVTIIQSKLSTADAENIRMYF